MRGGCGMKLRTLGVEPGSQAWEACMIPLHYVRLRKACDWDPSVCLQATLAWRALPIGVAQARPPGVARKPRGSAIADLYYLAHSVLPLAVWSSGVILA